MKCPFKKITTIDAETDYVGQKKISIDFGACDWKICSAAITHQDCSSHTFFDGCKLMEGEQKKMIIIGYPGIGKSTLAVGDNKYIDLESSLFNDYKGKKPKYWYHTYCKIAEDLSKQGYIVFVSCHKEVQDYLSTSNEIVALCYPALNLKNLWFGKLLSRYEQDPSDKNLAALTTSVKYFNTHITAIDNSTYTHKIILRSMDYLLDDEIKAYFNKVVTVKGE